MGEAFSGVQDDIVGLGYNPGSLGSLTSSQASLLYRTGISDDSYSQFMIGSPFKKSAFGLSVGYFNGGNIVLNDGVTQKSITVQKDLTIGLGYSFRLGLTNFGFMGKYLSSQLADQNSAKAYAIDAGFQLPISSYFHFGAAIQNIGTQLNYSDSGDNLPRMARAGISYRIIPGRSAFLLNLDGVYNLTDSNIYPAIGVEKLFGPLAFRAGYKGFQGLNQFSVGMGLVISRFSFDYSYGIFNEFDSTHLLSLSTKFGPIQQKDLISMRNDPVLAQSKPENLTPAYIVSMDGKPTLASNHHE